MKKLFHPAFLGLLITPVLCVLPVHPSDQCVFNGIVEGCSLKRLISNGRQIGTRVLWVKDGKVVSYYFYDCVHDELRERCKTKIVEDNGRVTYGTSFDDWRGTQIISQRGNKTIIPAF